MIGKNRRAKNNPIVLIVLLSTAALLCLTAAAGNVAAKDIYFYRDANGVMHFTDAPVDPRYQPFEVTTQIIIGVGSPASPASFIPFIETAAQLYNLDPALIKAVIMVESAFNPNAVSWAGAQGLMQLMPGTAQLMGVRNPFNPQENILGGCRYLRTQLDRFGNLELALAAYNAGPERVARVSRVPNIEETQAYVKRVVMYYNRYRNS